jgi:hypothetical protein
MEEHLRERIMRRLADLPDERGYQLLDYVEFLESRYANRSQPDNFFTRITEKVEDTLRAGKAPISAISGTVGLFDGAAKVVRGMAAAAQSVVEGATQSSQPPATPPQAPPTPPPSDPEPPR